MMALAGGASQWSLARAGWKSSAFSSIRLGDARPDWLEVWADAEAANRRQATHAVTLAPRIMPLSPPVDRNQETPCRPTANWAELGYAKMFWRDRVWLWRATDVRWHWDRSDSERELFSKSRVLL